ncbi:MAG TPA: T9SS type A sorting domain-containing protein, partial [Candidatus Kapabacteria bacterium]|nr:T9SS type A sorting domain-containing protein [Candidatus Kapabacteria bacterium]
GGATWNPLAKPIIGAGSVAGWNNSVAWAGNNGWFGTNSRQILRTTDRGQTWKSVKTSYQHSLGIGFDDDATHGIACFRPAASSGSTTTTGTNGMMVTADSGATWDTVKALPAEGISPSSIQFVPNSHLAILTSSMGIYRTTDFGATWSPIGIPVSYNPDGADLSISRGHGEFVVSVNSANNGIASYSETIPDSESEGVAERSVPELSFNINPNPLEGTAIVSFALPSSDRAHVAIYDAVGRKVLDIADRMFEQGQNHVTFDAHSLVAGAYYVILEASGARVTRAITILR